MGTKAIFKIYNEGKFVIGSWVKYDGGVEATSVFPYFLKNLKHKIEKKSFYDAINKFVNDGKFGSMFGDKKKPFINQINEDGMISPDVLFWDTNLSDKKLMTENIWGEYIYEVRFGKKNIKIKINYNSNQKEIEIKDGWNWVLENHPSHNDTMILSIMNDVYKWVDDIDYGLNDCNCGEDNNEITE